MSDEHTLSGEELQEYLTPLEAEEAEVVPDVHAGLGMLQAQNLRRLLELQAKRVGINPLNLLSQRIEALVDATMGPNGDAREAFEFIYESRIADTLDRIEEELKKPENLEAIAKQAGQTPSGLVLPGQ